MSAIEAFNDMLKAGVVFDWKLATDVQAEPRLRCLADPGSSFDLGER